MTSHSILACPVCHSSEPAKAGWHVPNHLHGIDGTFEVRKCAGCSSTWLVEPPRDVSALYPESYYAHAEREGGRFAELRRQVVRTRAFLSERTDLLRNVMPAFFDIDSRLATTGRAGGAVLDIGCGAGKALDTYRAHGWTTHGVETDDKAVALAVEKGHDVIRCDASREELPSGPYDVVRATHAIEHTSDPIGLVQRAAEAVAPGGALYIEIPNLAGLVAAVAGSAYWQLDPPLHLAIPHPHMLRRSLEDVGFDRVKSWTYSSGSQLALALAGILDDHSAIRLRLRERHSPSRRAAALALSPLAAALDLVRRGDNLCVLAHKCSVRPRRLLHNPLGTGRPRRKGRLRFSDQMVPAISPALLARRRLLKKTSSWSRPR